MQMFPMFTSIKFSTKQMPQNKYTPTKQIAILFALHIHIDYIYIFFVIYLIDTCACIHTYTYLFAFFSK